MWWRHYLASSKSNMIFQCSIIGFVWSTEMQIFVCLENIVWWKLDLWCAELKILLCWLHCVLEYMFIFPRQATFILWQNVIPFQFMWLRSRLRVSVHILLFHIYLVTSLCPSIFISPLHLLFVFLLYSLFFLFD